MTAKFDIIIVGAGMVGSSAAIALAQKGFQVALIERSGIPTFDVSEPHDLRVSAISSESQRLLSHIGVWPLIESQRLCPYQHMHVWDENSDGELDFNCADQAETQLGYIIENKLTQFALYQQLNNNPNIRSYWDISIEQLKQTPEQVSITLTDETQLTGTLLIAADGRQSKVRNLLGIRSVSRSYQQKAIVANVITENPHQFTAWQRFLSTGPLAFLPLTDTQTNNNESSIVWSCETQQADSLLNLNDADFCSALSEAFDFKLGKVSHTSKRAAFPLSWQYSENFVAERCIFIGDAAHGIHPLAGLGVNLGFSDVQLLTQLLQQKHLKSPKKMLRRYERERKHDSLSTLFSMSAINTTFLSQAPMLTHLRGYGMNWINQQNSIKRYMIALASNNSLAQ